MSQYGAYAMAQLGFSYDEICEFYFPGTEVRPYLNQQTQGGDVDRNQGGAQDASNVSQDLLDGVDDYSGMSQDISRAEAAG